MSGKSEKGRNKHQQQQQLDTATADPEDEVQARVSFSEERDRYGDPVSIKNTMQLPGSTYGEALTPNNEGEPSACSHISQQNSMAVEVSIEGGVVSQAEADGPEEGKPLRGIPIKRESDGKELAERLDKNSEGNQAENTRKKSKKDSKSGSEEGEKKKKKCSVM